MLFRLLIVSALFAAPALAQSSADLPAVQAHLRAVSSMTADFVQTDRAGKSLNGTLTLKRPGRIRFQYGQGVPILIVADGQRLNFIDYQVRQVSSWPIGNSPLAVLLDPFRDIAAFAKPVASGDPRIVLMEVRDRRRPQYGAITLAFARDGTAPAGLRLQGWVTLDAQNNRTTVRLSNQRFNVAVAEERFRWRDPRMRGPRG